MFKRRKSPINREKINNNLKISNTRSLLRNLKDLKDIQEDDWYIMIFFFKSTYLKDIIEQIVSSNPELKEDYDTFVSLYK